MKMRDNDLRSSTEAIMFKVLDVNEIKNREWNSILGEKHLGTDGEQESPVKWTKKNTGKAKKDPSPQGQGRDIYREVILFPFL